MAAFTCTYIQLYEVYKGKGSSGAIRTIYHDRAVRRLAFEPARCLQWPIELVGCFFFFFLQKYLGQTVPMCREGGRHQQLWVAQVPLQFVNIYENNAVYKCILF